MVMGAGAIGSLFGGYLSKAGNDVLLVGRKEHIQIINKNGLVIRNRTTIAVKPKGVDSIEQVDGTFDVILLTVKAHDTEQAVYEIKDVVNSKTTVVLLQNGLGIEDFLPKSMGMPLRGVTMNGSLLLEPGQILHSGEGDTIIGEQNGTITPRLKTLAETLTNAGLNTKVTEDIKRAVWMKTVVNSAINPLGALTGMKNGDLIQIPSLKRLMIKIVKEGMEAAEKSGVHLKEDPVDLTIKTAKLTSNNKNSMLQDILMNKKTEIEFINGAIAKYGRENQVATPINDILTVLIQAIEHRNKKETV